MQKYSEKAASFQNLFLLEKFSGENAGPETENDREKSAFLKNAPSCFSFFSGTTEPTAAVPVRIVYSLTWIMILGIMTGFYVGDLVAALATNKCKDSQWFHSQCLFPCHHQIRFSDCSRHRMKARDTFKRCVKTQNGKSSRLCFWWTKDIVFFSVRLPFKTLEEFSLQDQIKPLVMKDTAAHSYLKVPDFSLFQLCCHHCMKRKNVE